MSLCFTLNTRIQCYIFLVLSNLILLLSGDVHPNPGSGTNSDSSVSSISSSLDISGLSHHLSFVHYNIQSVLPKIDQLQFELSHFDIIAFSETWLNSSVESDDICFSNYRKPERKDRSNDTYGGVMIYVKNEIYYTRRPDLEINGVESIWIDLNVQNRKILFGLFYRPPSSNNFYDSSIEDSIHLAIDTGINDIIITGDFNWNALSLPSSRKVENICQQFGLTQSIQIPTHFTENSSSLIDLMFFRNRDSLLHCSVGDPFLNQNIRNHCPIYAYLKFTKPKTKSFSRQIWLFDQGDYDKLRNKVSEYNWDLCIHEDINIYAENFTSSLLNIAKECIPTRNVTIRPSEPPWINALIKSKIRKRKRLYRKAKSTNNNDHWKRFRQLRNEIVDLVRKAKTEQTEKLSSKLQSDQDYFSKILVVNP